MSIDVDGRVLEVLGITEIQWSEEEDLVTWRPLTTMVPNIHKLVAAGVLSPHLNGRCPKVKQFTNLERGRWWYSTFSLRGGSPCLSTPSSQDTPLLTRASPFEPEQDTPVASFITYFKAFQGIEPHFFLWKTFYF